MLKDMSVANDVLYAKYRIQAFYITLSVKRNEYHLHSTNRCLRARRVITYTATASTEGNVPEGYEFVNTLELTIPPVLPWFVSDRLQRITVMRLFLDKLHQERRTTMTR